MKIGFIGAGKMASALVSGVVKSKAFAKEDIVITDCDAAVAAALGAETGVKVLAGNSAVVEAVDVVLLCVKPADALAALAVLDTRGKLVISIVAGLGLAALEAAAAAGNNEVRMIRVMPNTPALIHKGAAGYSLGGNATAEDGAVAERIFGAVGSVFKVKEEYLDAVTGLSGSGPAYVYLIIEAMADGGVLMGLPRDIALKLAAQTVAGAAEMVLQTGQHPAALRDMVTSPGGTTIAGVEALEANGVRFGMIKAVRAATERARKLNPSK